MTQPYRFRGALWCIVLLSLAVVSTSGQTLTVLASPTAIAGGGGAGTIGSPYALHVRIQGWTLAANASVYLKAYNSTNNEYMWTGAQWSNINAYSGNTPQVTLDAGGNWSGWIYAKHNNTLGSTMAVRAALVSSTSTNLTGSSMTLTILNTDISGNGGWISRTSSPAANAPLLAYRGGTIVGTYRSEENNIAEGYAYGVGGFKIAVPAGIVDSIVALQEDGSRALAFVGPWSVSAGKITDAEGTITAVGKGHAVISPSVVHGGLSQDLTIRVFGESPAVLTNIIVETPHLWTWSRISGDVTAPGPVAVSGDSIGIGGLGLSGGDSVTIAIHAITPFDSTGPISFRISTGTGPDSVFPIATQPAVFVYSTPLAIGTVKENDANGVPVLNNTLVTVRGVVTVANEFGGPSSLQDNSGGIAVFGSSFSGSLAPGDEVIVSGLVQPFNGLTEIVNPMIQQIVSHGNAVEPVVATAAQIAGDGAGGVEQYEGRLVRLNGMIVAGNGTWAYQNYAVSDASGTAQLRIDNNTTLIGGPIPAGAFDVIGVVGQFIGTPPYIGGYQIMPRGIADIISTGPIISAFPEETAISPTSLTINWKTVRPGSTEIQFGKTASLELGHAGTKDSLTNHTVLLDGLEPATAYWIEVFSVAGADTSFAGPLVASTASPLSSTGAINVYFNHNVDTTVAWDEHALGDQALVTRVINRLDAAHRSIDVALYSLSGTPGPGTDVANALIAAQGRGVSVRVICEADNDGTSPLNVLRSAGIPVINDGFDVVNAGTGLMHNKFFVIDARGGAPESVWVWSGSWNPTAPGTFSDFQNSVEIQDAALGGAYTIEFNEMWGSATGTPDASASRFGARKRDNTPHKFVIGGRAVESYFSPSDHTTAHIQTVLDAAQHSVAVAMLTFTRSDLRTSLVNQKVLGRKVRAVLDNNTDSGNQYAALLQGGVDVHLKTGASGLFHHKYAVVDGESPWWTPVVVTGSHNWSSSAENSNNENTLIIHDGHVAGLYLQEFSARYKEFGGTDPITVGVDANQNDLPTQCVLEQNFPNPFNPATLIRFEVPVGTRHAVSLHVYDLLGREVAVLVDEFKNPGRYEVQWDARGLSSGMYICRMTAGKYVAAVKMVLVR